MQVIQTTLSKISEDQFLRNDEKFYRFLEKNGWDIFGNAKHDSNRIPLRDILIEDYKICDYQKYEEYKGVPTGQQYIDTDGDIVSYDIVTNDDHPQRLKYSISADNIVLSSLRLAKSPAFMFDADEIDQYVFSNGFYIFKVADESKWRPRFICYLLRHTVLKHLLDDNLYRGIGISSYKSSDLLNVQIKNLSVNEQDQVLERIALIESKISKLKQERKSHTEIIDAVFQREFSVSRLAYDKIEQRKWYNSTLTVISTRNTNIRLSYRWNKAHKFQDYLSTTVECACVLGEHILATKNGWSPTCNDAEGTYQVLGIDAIQKNGILSFDAPKYSSEKKDNLDEYKIKEGDFFVSRGNTVDLVSLASIAHSVPNDMPATIYPDLMIRIEFDDKVDKEYMAYVFNSFIGRGFFKYSTKGKNQTMVKVSPQELCAFVVPLPTIHEQRRIVKMIHRNIEEQHTIEKQILKLREQIDQIITDAIA